MHENNRIEYKRELNDRFERAVVSFLNYAGGRRSNNSYGQ